MHRTPCRWLLPAAFALVAAAAQSQPAPRAAAPTDPLDARAAVPPVAYRSSLGEYRRLVDEQPVGWRQANDTVGRIGGWRAYAREASQPAAAASTPGGTVPAGPGGHKTH